MKQNQKTIATIDNKRAIRINSWPVLTFSSVAEKKTGRGREVRDFKIGHYGRLGRLDAYTRGLGPWR